MYAQHKTINEIYDICAVRVIVDTVADCYNVLGYRPRPLQAHPGPLQGLYLHPEAERATSRSTRPSSAAPASRSRSKSAPAEMHKMAEYGVAAHWKYKQGLDKKAGEETFAWIRQLLEAQQDTEAEDFIKNTQGRPVRGRGIRIHPEGRRGQHAGRRDADRPCLCHPLRRRQPHDRLQGQRPHRADSTAS